MTIHDVFTLLHRAASNPEHSAVRISNPICREMADAVQQAIMELCDEDQVADLSPLVPDVRLEGLAQRIQNVSEGAQRDSADLHKRVEVIEKRFADAARLVATGRDALLLPEEVTAAVDRIDRELAELRTNRGDHDTRRLAAVEQRVASAESRSQTALSTAQTLAKSFKGLEGQFQNLRGRLKALLS